MPAENLTGHLLSLSSTSAAYKDATEHEFLIAIGKGTVSKDILALWIAQDRIFTSQAYAKFTELLIAKVPSTSHPDSVSDPSSEPDGAEKTEEILSLLRNVQGIIKVEMKFLNGLAEKYELNLEGWDVRKETNEYMDVMLDVGRKGTLVDGMIFLWTMATVFYHGWKTASALKHQRSESLPPTRIATNSNPEVDAICDELIGMWANRDFKEFIDRVGVLVDSFEIGRDSKPGEWDGAIRIWDEVARLGSSYFPNAEETEERM